MFKIIKWIYFSPDTQKQCIIDKIQNLNEKIIGGKVT